MKHNACNTLVALLGALLLVGTGARAADMPATNVKVIGIANNLNMFKTVEKPFWTEIVPQESNGMITADYISMTDVGIKGTEQLRLAKLGVLEFFSGNIAVMAADNMVFDAVDMIGVMPTFEKAREMMDAYGPVVARHMAEQFNVKLLMTWPNPAQVIYCKPEIGGVADIKGKKVRVSTKGASDFVSAVGGIPVTIQWAEVIPAAQRGALDCGITGTLSGNTGKWWEVFDYHYPITLTWGMWFHAVNLDTWNRLDPSVQAFFDEKFAEQEETRWAVASEETQDGINCNTGAGPCKYGVQADMTLVPVTDADLELLNGLVETHIVPSWAKACGAECVEEWNATAGKVLGITASAN